MQGLCYGASWMQSIRSQQVSFCKGTMATVRTLAMRPPTRLAGRHSRWVPHHLPHPIVYTHSIFRFTACYRPYANVYPFSTVTVTLKTILRLGLPVYARFVALTHIRRGLALFPDRQPASAQCSASARGSASPRTHHLRDRTRHQCAKLVERMVP